MIDYFQHAKALIEAHEAERIALAKQTIDEDHERYDEPTQRPEEDPAEEALDNIHAANARWINGHR